MTTCLRRAIENQEFVITAEVAPPKGGNPQHMVDMASLLKEKVHGVNVTDGSRAVMRMSSIAASTVLLQNGIEPIFQMACRDRNVIGLQADLMGAYALGLRNMLALTGDPVKAGDHPKARPVFDLESVRLLKLITKLNGGKDFNDKKLPDGALDLFAGAAVDPQLKSWYSIESRFAKKVESGARFFQSQMITDFIRLEEFMSRVASQHNVPVLAGIFLLKSAKNAKFINRCVPGAQIPDSIIERLEYADQPLEEGIKIAAEQVKIAKDLCQGVHLMAVKREDLIPKVLELAEISIKTDKPVLVS
ncbi:methylenetetrahydrofolate reductase [[Leptolyngbya] sp. PCC 7376]|uniref:methylenetetrahydrofolate reductase n=1 Tax=[Leptolyngbya] sp. PCC 7376 TaxID=111781 RepID=UPI00029F3EDE|nr:methylenetetrahydrofolate reductase [[Leptolyngbya] sp. PCC 7376]AFY38012.1 methylenetetrahydrofolate reductase [[Leptolyngbya] sp. PCC 7376]